jgi:RNA polymerase sigma-70 factor, ECF subfamily
MAEPGTSAGEADARARFDACFRAHHADVLAYAWRRVGDRALADDIAAETFAVAWRRRDSIPADPLAWLIGVARHVLLNERRSSRRRDRLDARVGGEPAAGAGDPADIVAERTAILAALGRLSERDREALRLAAWEGLGRDEAAAVLGCTRAAYALRLYRARRRLAGLLAEGCPAEAGTCQLHAAEIAREEAR